MALNLRNGETERLVREFARRRGIGLTEAVHEAVETAMRLEIAPDEHAGKTLVERLQPLYDRLDRYPKTGLKADKAFFDELWGQEGD